MCPPSITLSQPLQCMWQSKAGLAKTPESVIFQASLSYPPSPLVYKNAYYNCSYIPVSGKEYWQSFQK